MFNDNIYSQYIFTSRYARYIDKENRRELWPETIKRYFDFIQESLLEKHNFDVAPYREELEAAVLRHDIMPSMRALMTAGVAAKKNEIGLYNCLGGDTLVTTKEYGIIPIKELVGKSVNVVDGNGEWCLSKCMSYGKQDLYKINLVTSGVGTFSINATENHRWFDRTGKEILTKNLSKGTLLANVSLPNRIEPNENSEDYKKGIIHGIVYGDGTAIYKNGYGHSTKDIFSEKICSGFAIRLCNRSKELLKYFEEYPRSFPNSYNGDPVVYLKNATVDLKDLPNNDEFFTDDYMIGFIRGWIAADGCVGKTVPQVTLATTLKGMEWIYKYGPKYGFSILHNRKFSKETNLGERKQDLFNIEFDRRYLIPNDFILQYKKDLFKIVNKSIGKVLSVEFHGKEEVYCFEVPTTQSFMLTKNILTGNCLYLPIDSLKAFDEEMAILMSGTGVGFSVENEYVKQIPCLPDEFFQSETIVVFDDSRIGWAKGFREFLSILMTGQIPRWDVSKLRPAGARLKTMGGRSSGPEPLVDLLKFVINIFIKAAGRQLTSLECHDIACKIADIVIVGGVRRSALISLSDLNDDRMRDAKSGNWWQAHSHRRLSNNSAVYEETPEIGVFMKEWLSLYESKSGERGIINRKAMKKVVENANQFREEFNLGYRKREVNHKWGSNPCSEIILMPNEFCNLTSVQIYEDDTIETIKEKIRLATILGTFQSCFTDFKYIGKKYQKNCENERLLGVSLNGIYDNEITNGRAWLIPSETHFGNPPYVFEDFLEDLKTIAIFTNDDLAKEIGINPSVAITCVKPEGTTSAFNGTSSGIHPAHSPYYIRYVRNSISDPLTSFMIAKGFPFEKDAYDPNNQVCFKFPIKSSSKAIFKKDIGAIEHLELWLTYQKHFTEHKPSITVSVKESEWLDVGAWCYKNFEWLSGVAFLPADEGSTVYKQMPFTECSEEEYKELLAKMPENIDWTGLTEFEIENSTTNAMDLACVGSVEGCLI